MLCTCVHGSEDLRNPENPENADFGGPGKSRESFKLAMLKHAENAILNEKNISGFGGVNPVTGLK